MNSPVFPTWVFLVAALVIALAAFGMAQMAPGAGMPFVIAATTLWIAYVATRHSRMKSNG